jgi:preprotein translocase subunit SecE
VKEYLPTIIGLVITAVVVGVLWRKGYFERLAQYVHETREELKKCTWPSKDELIGSTIVVLLSIAILGFFTIAIDFVVAFIIRKIV